MLGVLTGLLDSFARGGGGGSGGGDDGGGIIILVGYVPMHFLGARFRKSKHVNIGSAVVWPIAVIYSIILIFVFGGWGVAMAAGALAGAGAGLYGWFGRLKRNKKAEVKLQAAAATDSAWDITSLNTTTAQIFAQFQADWSRGDTQAMRAYLTPWYHYHISLMMAALAQTSRVNQMSNIAITAQNIVDVVDNTDSSQDQFVMGFEASATDQLIDTRDQQTIFTDNNVFIEYWTFQRSGDTWLLAGINQATANLNAANATIQQFATERQFGYSLDWGWLLLPRRGQLFGSGKFGVSDINNHVIGVYNKLLIQIYTYTPRPGNNSKEQYLVAQVALPKSYGEILVRRKKRLRWSRIKGMDKISLEWQDFNKKYDVFASTAEGPTSFELLHPVFMEVLESMPFEVNLEVVDNIVYFYTKETHLKPEHYPAFLAILQEAFKQMRL